MNRVKRTDWCVQLHGAVGAKELILVGDGEEFFAGSNSRLYVLVGDEDRYWLHRDRRPEYTGEIGPWGYERRFLALGPHHLLRESHGDHEWVNWFYDGKPVELIEYDAPAEYTLMDDGSISVWVPQAARSVS